MPLIAISCRGKEHYEAVGGIRFVSRIPIAGELIDFRHPRTEADCVCRVIQVMHHVNGSEDSDLESADVYVELTNDDPLDTTKAIDGVEAYVP